MKKIIRVLNLVFILILGSSIHKVNAEVINNNEASMDLKQYYEYNDKSRLENKIANVSETELLMEGRVYNDTNTLDSNTLSYSEIKKLIKDRVYKSLVNIESTIDISDLCTNIYYDDAQDIFSAYFDAIYENPNIFYAPNKVGMSYAYDRNTKKLIKCNLNVSYQYSNSEILEMTNAFNNKVNYILEEYLSNTNDKLALEYIINDYLLDNTTYDYDNYLKDTIPDISHTAYGALINGVAVCDGYAKAVKVLANILGIESGIVTSSEMNHAWNYININGKYYNLDVTFNDPVPESNERIYTYFNKSNDEMSTSHTWNKSQYPECSDESFKFLRNFNPNDISRINDRIYYVSSNRSGIYSIDLLGKDNRIELQGLYPRYMVSYNNTLNFLEGYKVKSYNIKSKEFKTLFELNYNVSGLYITDNILNINPYDTDSYNIERISLKINEDFNNDSVVDIEDLSNVSLKYGLSKGDTNWRDKYDLNLDNIIDIFDLTMLAKKL
ncbi:transglutaminase domain-containing protein [Clostridium sp. MB05]